MSQGLPPLAKSDLDQGAGATAANTLRLVHASDDALMGIVTETAPASDTASSGLNGRLQRIAQRITSLIALVPAALTGSGNFKIALVEDTTSNKSVNVAQLAGTTTSVNSGNKDAGTLRVVLATDQPALTNKLLVTPDSVALSANQSVNVAQINGVTPLMGAGNTGTGSPRVTIATDQAVVPTAPAVSTSGGWTPSRTVSAASDNATSVKGSAGQLGFVIVTNVNAAMRYLHFYNKASAPTLGTDVPVLTVPIPGNTAGTGAVFSVWVGVTFTTGIAFACTTTTGGTPASGNTAANDITISLGYK